MNNDNENNDVTKSNNKKERKRLARVKEFILNINIETWIVFIVINVIFIFGLIEIFSNSNSNFNSDMYTKDVSFEQ